MVENHLPKKAVSAIPGTLTVPGIRNKDFFSELIQNPYLAHPGVPK